MLENSIYCPPGWEHYPQLPIDCFEDNRSGREVLDDYDDSGPEDPTEPENPQDPDEYIDNAIEDVKYAPSRYDGKCIPGEEGSPPGKWYAQPKYVEVWIEEAGLGKKFRKVLDGRNVRIILNHGFSSLTFAYLNCVRLKEFADDHPDKEIYVRYFGDLDLYGEDMDRQIQEWLDLFGISDLVSFERIAITDEQIKKYHLLEKDYSAEKIEWLKENDSIRYDRFVEKHDRIFACELNSMLINKRLLGVFEKIVQDSVDRLWDEDIYYENCPDEPDLECDDIDPDSVPEGSEDGLTIRQSMYRKITEAFYLGWENDLFNSTRTDNRGGTA